jgi:hypothetical protein
LFLDAKGKSSGLKMFMSQAKGLSAVSHCRACCSLLVFSEQFASLVDGDESSWILTESCFNFLAIERFWGPQESFIQGLHFVNAVRWKENHDNSGRFVAASFLAAHSLNSCLHPSRSHFFL